MKSKIKGNAKNKNIYIALGITILLIIPISGYAICKNTTARSEKQNSESLKPEHKPSTTPSISEAEPVPFKELTIPYLRDQHWEGSNLAALEKVAEYTNYTSYITSYQSEGLKIDALLTKPKGEMPENGWPGIIFVHGYIPPSEYHTLNNYEVYVDFLADRGFVVFKTDLRGHGDSGGSPSSGYFSADYVIDVLNAYASLKKTDFIDQVGLWGHSMSGNLVFRAMVINQNIPATVIWAGATYTYEDFFEYSINDNSYQPPNRESEAAEKRSNLFDIHGNFDPNNSFWRQVVPTNYLNGVKGSIQLHHAVNDPVVDIEYSKNLMKILDGTAIEHQLYEYPNGGHNIRSPNFSTAMQQTAEFFRSELAD